MDREPGSSGHTQCEKGRMIVVNNESDVRKYCRDALGDYVKFLEPALGSTIGMPDCLIPVNRIGHTAKHPFTIFIELKVGEFTDKVDKDTGEPIVVLEYDVRVEQKKVHRWMVEIGLPSYFMVFVKGGSLGFLIPSYFEGAIAGRVRQGHLDLWPRRKLCIDQPDDLLIALDHFDWFPALPPNRS